MPAWIDAAIRVAIMLFFVFNIVMVLIYMERKVLAHIQQRLGPMRTGFHGILQSPADAIKLMVKEDLAPSSADKWVFRSAPYLVFVPIFMMFVAIPFSSSVVIRHLDMGLFYLVAFSSLSIVGMLMAGWGSDNKYALLGGVRAAAQLISYELPLGISILGVALLTQSLRLGDIASAQYPLPFIFAQPLGFVIFITASLAEMSRTPFDIPVAESELVGGPLVEYSGMRWAVFFLAEYANLVATSAIAVLIFLGGWSWPFYALEGVGWLMQILAVAWFFTKVFALIFVVFWLRGTLPRLRIDQLMTFAWKLLIPFSFVNLLLTAAAVIYGTAILALVWVATACLGYTVYAYARSR
ncbi:MAG: NADH-quinone oxidoreductase subunit NuoH [Dehalococcoidia bacterium]|nr:NADH-quinone oxidoreductase subunit NuoH [Dehalococcoidia bacterium]